MADIEWQPLPALWPSPAIWTDVGDFVLLVFTQDGVPTWEVRRRAKSCSSSDDLIADGTADTFEAARPRHSSKQERSPQNEDAVSRNSSMPR
jgi:hypothetical protein